MTDEERRDVTHLTALEFARAAASDFESWFIAFLTLVFALGAIGATKTDIRILFAVLAVAAAGAFLNRAFRVVDERRKETRSRGRSRA